MGSNLHDGDILISKHPLGQPALEKRIMHYSNFHHILLVGEGDFSFSAALAKAFGSAENIVATSLDSREEVISSYNSGQDNLRSLEKRRAMTLHSVDAKTMKKHEILREMLFDRIVFNFPHAGFFGKENDNKLIKKHRHLLKMFFKNGMAMLNNMGEIHVTHKEKDPYDKWKLVEQAETCGLLFKESVDFNKAEYPGYTNRRGAGPNIGYTFHLGECRTYMFIVRESMTTPCMSLNYNKESVYEALRLKEDAANQRDATILELGIERKARKDAESAKANIEGSLNYNKESVYDFQIKKINQLERQRDDALYQQEAACREKEKIARQLNEASRLKGEAIYEKEKILRERNDLANQKDEIDYWAIVAFCGLGLCKIVSSMYSRKK
ncbi:heavy metal-associated isoprenylated plant protein 41 [Cryptomeria japonica]|uniref:heavy metal-associated isoprenylated plant protein 41 n=1 Tax=Cryptomeria japonica TaxID=3369 RepID=UPI0027D9DA59|nr:heavy metal-associated isoprenylated plant protein 41 [Cryptomeria japonica]XP_059069425.1 heavy metal-associated isoprenylated plant protein 41 [Cryptomeria japonica]